MTLVSTYMHKKVRTVVKPFYSVIKTLVLVHIDTEGSLLHSALYPCALIINLNLIYYMYISVILLYCICMFLCDSFMLMFVSICDVCCSVSPVTSAKTLLH